MPAAKLVAVFVLLYALEVPAQEGVKQPPAPDSSSEDASGKNPSSREAGSQGAPGAASGGGSPSESAPSVAGVKTPDAGEADSEARLAKKLAAAKAKPSTETRGEDAAVLHAQALLAEHDGQWEQALQLVRQAAQLSDDPVIAFDRARLALQASGAGGPEDFQPFLGREPQGESEQLLRAAILAHQGEHVMARGELQGVLAQRPGNALAQRLQAALDQRTPKSVRRWRFSAAFGSAFDSNVSLFSETAVDPARALRMSVSGAAVYSPLVGKLAVDLMGAGHVSAYVNDRSRARGFDSEAFLARAAVTKQGELLDIFAAAYVQQVFVDSFSNQFMQEGGVELEVRLWENPFEPGVYAQASGRDFVVGPADPLANGRDGPRLAAGVMAETQVGGVLLAGRGGFQGELARGDERHELGAEAALLAMVQSGPWAAQLRFDYQWRNYARSATKRRDHRLAPHGRVTYRLTEPLQVVLSHTWMHNQSRRVYRYDRHVTQLALQGGW